MSVLIVALSAFLFAGFPQLEPVVSKAAISVHTVRRGDMRLRIAVGGSITSVSPGKAVVTALANAAGFLRTDQSVNFEFQVRPAGGGALPVISGKVMRIDNRSNGESLEAEIDFEGALPEVTTVGTRIGALLDTGEELRNIVLLERPADSRPNTESTIFVMEAGDGYARRVSVRYGRMSGPQIEVIEGLAPGDRVIVSDMPAAANASRVRLE